VKRIHSVTRNVLVPDINFISAILEFDNGSIGVMINSWTSGRRIFRVQMHSPGIWVEADPEYKGRVYADGDTAGIEYDTKEVAGSNEFYIYAGFQAKNREFIDCLKARKQPSSNFSDALKTMEIAEKILAKALLGD
jgi:virulence factor